MDTPQKNQICTPMSKFEDSPVFNYINSLSPIKPVKSLHIAQTLNSLTYASPPSVFTSPHVNFQKEPSILKRHYFPSSSKPEFSSEDGRESSMCGRSLEAVRMSDSAVDFPDSCDPGIPIREVTAVPTNETAELPIELPQTLNYVCGIPELTLGPNNIETDPLPLICEREEVAVEMHHSSESGVELQGTHEFEQTKIEGTGNDWETLISNPADVLIYDSINNPEGSSGQETLVHSENNSHSPVAKLMEYGFDDSHKSNQHVTEGPAAQLEELKFQKETDHTPHILSSTFQSMQVVPCDESDEKAGDCTPLGCKQRGIRRRCLVFESVGSQKKSMVDTRHSSSFASLSDGKFGSRDTHLVPFRPTTGSSPCLLPGIGLHLNALAATTKDSRVVKHETLASGKRLISMPTSIASFHSNKPLALSSVRSDMGIAGNIFQISQDDSSGPNFGEELNESSPRKKRLKLEQAGESSCKRCNCKKSKCLKLYCECFAAGVYCVEPCSCQDCHNKPIHEYTVLATRKQIETRNPLAFAPKVVRTSESIHEIGEESSQTPASARHKRGCNCKKSSCLKKYCECYQGGVGCSINCRCEGCKNAFGKKDGFASMGLEEAQQQEEDESGSSDKNNGSSDKNNTEKSLQYNELGKGEGQYPDPALPVKFSFPICRTSVQLPYPSIGRLTHSSHPPQPKFEKHSHLAPDDETPEILRGNCSPISGVKTVSPNRKRVSPPHGGFEPTPGRRSSRKLILQSIPSFPSLTHHESDDFK